jgi:hypothetical protein
MAVQEFVLPEVWAAANWWGDRLSRREAQDNGDKVQSAFATWAASTAMPLSTEEREKFVEALSYKLQDRCLTPKDYDPRPWRPEQPNWGSALRCVGVDYHPAAVLEEAAEAALGADRTRELSPLWPIKTLMWIDPGVVRVQHGYGAERKDIFPAREDA